MYIYAASYSCIVALFKKGKMKKNIYFYIIPLLLTILFFSACKKTKDEPQETEEDAQMVIGQFSDNWTCNVKPGKTSNFDIAEFTVWVPNPSNVSDIQAILVLALHSNSSALGLVYEKEWQDYAKQNHLALLAVHLENLKPNITFEQDYPNAANGSGQALLMALEAIATKNNISQLAQLPFLFRGYSAGGMFSYNFSAFQPKRVIAFANIRGWAMNESNADNNSIPGLFLIAEYDTVKYQGTNPFTKMKDIVKTKRKQNALWGYAIEPGEDHSGALEKSDTLIRLFFTSALKLRLAAGTTILQSVPESSGWLGNNDSLTAYSYNNYPLDKNKASWLIDQPFSDAWKIYQKK